MKERNDCEPGLGSTRGQCAKRLSITEAAETVFSRHGFAAASLDMIATEAGVSRQTIYNHYGDKENLFIAVVGDMTARMNAVLFSAIATFPDHPIDLEGELSTFAIRLIRNCLCDREGRALKRLIEAEGNRYPELFVAWRDHGPGKAWSLIGGHLARLACDGLITIGDPDIAARQFMALIFADIQINVLLGESPSDQEVGAAARQGVRTFLHGHYRNFTAETPAPTASHAALG